MEDNELKQMWQAYDTKLDKLLVLNMRNFEQLQTEKVSSKMNAFVRHQLVGIVLGIAWCAFLGFLLFYTTDNLWFSISALVILIASAAATLLYIRHVVLIKQINLDDSITNTQQKLATIKASDIETGRLLVLTTPFYTTWFIHPQMINTTGGMVITFGATLFFTLLSIYLYQALAPKKRHKKWVQRFLNSFGGKEITKAMAFLDEMETFKKNDHI